MIVVVGTVDGFEVAGFFESVEAAALMGLKVKKRTCRCPFCDCDNAIPEGGVCGDCLQGGHAA